MLRGLWATRRYDGELGAWWQMEGEAEMKIENWTDMAGVGDIVILI